jgi:hypothetical protein
MIDRQIPHTLDASAPPRDRQTNPTHPRRLGVIDRQIPYTLRASAPRRDRQTNPIQPPCLGVIHHHISTSAQRLGWPCNLILGMVIDAGALSDALTRSYAPASTTIAQSHHINRAQMQQSSIVRAVRELLFLPPHTSGSNHLSSGRFAHRPF